MNKLFNAISQMCKRQKVSPMYDTVIFSSKEAEEEWHSAPTEVKKIRNTLLNETIVDMQMRLKNELDQKLINERDKHTVESWKKQAELYEWLYLQQKEIAQGYRQIIEEQEKIINNLKLN